MVEIVLWKSQNFDFEKAGNVLYENPRTGFLHNYTIISQPSSLIDQNFLLDFEWEILDAKVKPQCHVVITDSRDLVNLPNETLQKICACAIAFTIEHPMKYLIFYDVASHTSPEEFNQAALLYHFIESQSTNLSLFVRIYKHRGVGLETKFLPNGQLNTFGTKVLARSILMQVMDVLNHV